MLPVWLDGAGVCRAIIHQNHSSEALLQVFGYLNGNYFKASTVHCSHGTPTWQTKESDLSKHLDSNQRALLSTNSHAFSHSFAARERMPENSLYMGLNFRSYSKLLLQQILLQYLTNQSRSQGLNGSEI